MGLFSACPSLAEQKIDEGVFYSGSLHQGRLNGDVRVRTQDAVFQGTYAYGKPVKGAYRLNAGDVLLADHIQAQPNAIVVKGQLRPHNKDYILVSFFTFDAKNLPEGVIAIASPRPSSEQKRIYKSGITRQGIYENDQPIGRLVVTDENGLDRIEQWHKGQRISQAPGPLSIKARVAQQGCQFPPPYNTWAWYGFTCSNNNLNGTGIAYSPDGKHTFSGSVKNNQWAQGDFEDDANRLLTGQWKNFQLHGEGSDILKGELQYQGPYQLGKRHGQGICQDNGKWAPCKYFKGKKLANQSTQLAKATQKTQQLIASAERFQTDQVAKFNRDREQSSSLWRNRQTTIREKESRRQTQVAQNKQLYYSAIQKAEQTAQEMAVIQKQTNDVIQTAYAQQAAKNEAARQKYLRDKAQYEADIKRKQAEQAAYIADLEKKRDAKVAEINAQRRAEREKEKADCIAGGHTWNDKGNNCRIDTHIVIGETCFDENHRPRGCTLDEFKAIQRKRKAEQTASNTVPDNWPKEWSRPATYNTPVTDDVPAATPNKTTGGAEEKEKTPRKRKNKNDIIHVEAIAYCNIDPKEQWWCHGPLQNLIIREKEPVQDTLSAAGCDNAKESRRVPFKDPKHKYPGWIYYCEYGMNSYDIDITKRYSIPNTLLQNRNSYRCPEFTVSTCDTFYRAQDGNRPNLETVPADTP